MTRRLTLSAEATEDLTDIRRWQRQPGAGQAARQRLLAIARAIGELRNAPCLPPRGDKPGTRKLTVRAHVVIYRVRPDTGDNATAGDVEVLRIFSPGRQQEL